MILLLYVGAFGIWSMLFNPRQRISKDDDERKKYISKLEIEIGELKSYIEEIESDLGIEKLRTKVKNQAKQLHELNQMIHLSRMTKGRVKELEYVI